MNTHLIEKTKTDSNRIVKQDSVFVYIQDSVFVKISPDTVFYERHKNIYRDRWHTDTFTLIKKDSVFINDNKTEIVEVNKLYWWQKTLMWIGVGMAIIAILKVMKIFKIF